MGKDVQVKLWLKKDYVVCSNCDCCYGATNEPTFCQKFSRPVDQKNMDAAKECELFFPKVIGRVHAGEEYGKDHECWYEVRVWD